MEMMKKLALIYFNRLNEIRSGVSNLVKIFRSKDAMNRFHVVDPEPTLV